ncbi:MAG: ATP-dependent protease La domain protein, partial [Enterovirga sp.]|nr:ATP-dependent protease La domain protein [Enterovirga sp.]
MNVIYEGPQDLPDTLPIFPLAGALLLPRGQMPLNIFEPRYLAMVDAALAGPRLIGMVQPRDPEEGGAMPELFEVGCVGRVVQWAETGDGRYLISLTGIARFDLLDEVSGFAPFRQRRVSYDRFVSDFRPRAGEEAVDRPALLTALRSFTQAAGLQMDWDGVEQTPNEALVNALSMLAPFGFREKQALLEAADLKSRAEMLVALAEIELAKNGPA